MINTKDNKSIEYSIPSDILKLQKRLCEYEKDSTNYKKYKQILAKHIKNHNMKKRVNSDIKTIEKMKELDKNLD